MKFFLYIYSACHNSAIVCFSEADPWDTSTVAIAVHPTRITPRLMTFRCSKRGGILLWLSAYHCSLIPLFRNLKQELKRILKISQQCKHTLSVSLQIFLIDTGNLVLSVRQSNAIKYVKHVIIESSTCSTGIEWYNSITDALQQSRHLSLTLIL